MLNPYQGYSFLTPRLQKIVYCYQRNKTILRQKQPQEAINCCRLYWSWLKCSKLFLSWASSRSSGDQSKVAAILKARAGSMGLVPLRYWLRLRVVMSQCCAMRFLVMPKWVLRASRPACKYRCMLGPISGDSPVSK